MQSEGPQTSAGRTETRTNLIVNYLPQAMNEKELQCMFMTIGTLKSCKVMKDFKTGYSYGFGFVDFQRPEDAAKAIETLNGLDVMNKKIKVSYARPPGENIKDSNLYVAGIPRDYNEAQLEQVFASYGAIIQRNILKDKITGASRGVGFVRFDTKDEAQAAIAGLDGTIPPGGTEAFKIKIAEDHGKQKAAYNAGWTAGANRGPRVQAPAPFGSGGFQEGMMGKYAYDGGLPSRAGVPLSAYGGIGAMRSDRPNNRYNPLGYGMFQ
ncbi:unnamed protein product [Notodromas monacha]|uniref:RRM domain-containing protein n=1 Tax=Notodromas monacha TaxID=399045 RepID=A0A7R9BJI3_9CRUS|nr:unnamed protein product [Notodromas monacha]CAG0915812.1 unnamed protein product [Notodromas monacha]